MLSYRHAFHAANHADVLKHLVLYFCLDYLNNKSKPYLYLDTHAGAGSYKLQESYAAINREWQSGITRLLDRPDTGSEGQTPAAVRDYLQLVRRYYDSDSSYPGSPLIAATRMREQDRAVLYELHTGDYDLLKTLFASDKRITCLKQDGFSSFKAQLPPLSRRACIMIDPSYELKEDYKTLPLALEQALKRFPGGIYICWFPLLRDRDWQAFSQLLFSLHQGTTLLCTLQVQAAGQSGRGMYGSGLCIYNPPWTLKDMLEESLPFLERQLGDTNASSTLLCK